MPLQVAAVASPDCDECVLACDAPHCDIELTEHCTDQCVVVACDDPHHAVLDPALDTSCEVPCTNENCTTLDDFFQCCMPPYQHRPAYDASQAPYTWEQAIDALLASANEPISSSYTPTPDVYPSSPVFDAATPAHQKASSTPTLKCMWGDCNVAFSSMSDLVGHVNLQHLRLPATVVPSPVQPGPQSLPDALSCLWADCQLYPTPNSVPGPSNVNHNGVLASHLLQDHLGLPTVPAPQVSVQPAAPLASASSPTTAGPPTPGPEHDCTAPNAHACRWDACGQSFTSCDALTKHITNTHVGSGKAHYDCFWGDCQRHGSNGFASKQKICRHLQSHTGHRPFQCQVCQQNFSESATLAQHMRRHTQEKPYACDFPGCGKSFAITGALTIHKRTHNGQKPFKCTYCDRFYSVAPQASSPLSSALPTPQATAYPSLQSLAPRRKIMYPVKRSTFSVLVGASQLIVAPIRIVLPHQHVLSRPRLLITYPQQPTTPVTSSALPNHNVVQVTRGFQVIINSHLMSAIQRKTAPFSPLLSSLPLQYPKTSPIYGNDRLALVRYCPLFRMSSGTEEDASVSIVEKQTAEVFLGVVRAPGYDTSSESSFTSKKLVSDSPELRCDAVSFISPLPSSFSAFVASIVTDEVMDLFVAPPIEGNVIDVQTVSESCELDMELAHAASVPLTLCDSQMTITTFDDASTVRNKCDPQSNEMSKPASVDLTDAPDAPGDIELQQQDESITLVAPSPTDSPNTSQEPLPSICKIMFGSPEVVEAYEPVEIELARNTISLPFCATIDTSVTVGITTCRTMPNLSAQWHADLAHAISLPCLLNDKHDPMDEMSSSFSVGVLDALLDTEAQEQNCPITLVALSYGERQPRIVTSKTAPNVAAIFRYETHTVVTHAPSLPVALCTLGDKSDRYDLPVDDTSPTDIDAQPAAAAPRAMTQANRRTRERRERRQFGAMCKERMDICELLPFSDIEAEGEYFQVVTREERMAWLCKELPFADSSKFGEYPQPSAPPQPATVVERPLDLAQDTQPTLDTTPQLELQPATTAATSAEATQPTGPQLRPTAAVFVPKHPQAQPHSISSRPPATEATGPRLCPTTAAFVPKRPQSTFLPRSVTTTTIATSSQVDDPRILARTRLFVKTAAFYGRSHHASSH
ncbi:hypothetical protein EUX98_g6723 [Antrodiella citrinella]|uniref:C2H2-type domain-containing protein n=1 Tax=Antrodiella citrinella TaxID=2447956 RepID=A0A4S4MNA4_9APHY|nr:hypothetical protein EUX98_g6723 [Antrodiella citrinella]